MIAHERRLSMRKIPWAKEVDFILEILDRILKNWDPIQ